jgi:hypothetical protein
MSEGGGVPWFWLKHATQFGVAVKLLGQESTAAHVETEVRLHLIQAFLLAMRRPSASMRSSEARPHWSCGQRYPCLCGAADFRKCY